MYKKYFTFSYDDGLEQDKKIIKILERYGLKATFNISSGILGRKTKIGRLGEYGISEMALEKRTFLKTYDHYIIPEDEIAQVYQGHEVASHTYRHENLAKMSAVQIKENVSRDRKKLSELVGYQVCGLAYPYGASSDEAVNALKETGILYGRVVKSSGSFDFPQDPLRLQPTCWHADKNIMELLEQFIRMEPGESDKLFYIWGHGYELDYGSERNSWYRFEKICEKIADCNDIVFCTNKEAMEAFDIK